MICLESSFLIDWFRKQEYARQFLEEQDAETRILVPTPVLHELFIGAIQTGGTPDSTDRVYDALSHVEFIDLSPAAAEEAAHIRLSLQSRGKPIGGFDSLIAGITKNADATLVAADQHFDRVDGLKVLNPRHD